MEEKWSEKGRCKEEKEETFICLICTLVQVYTVQYRDRKRDRTQSRKEMGVEREK